MSCEQKVIMLVSSGQNLPPLGTTDHFALLERTRQFKQSGGIIICVGLRASGAGYNLLQQLASGGFFINITGDGVAPVNNAISTLLAMAGYFCAANVAPYGYSASQYGYSPSDANTGNQAPVIDACIGDLMPVSGGVATANLLLHDGTWYDCNRATGSLFIVTNAAYSGGNRAWAQYAFPAPIQASAFAVIGFSVTPSVLPSIAQPGASYRFVLAGSNDGSTWATLYTGFSDGKYTLPQPKTYKYWRLTLDTQNGSASAPFGNQAVSLEYLALFP